MAKVAIAPVRAAEEVVEAWVARTQDTLGCCITKPRMLAERLRRPPFRFLFDAAHEVAKETGFGRELFGGAEVLDEALVPFSREEKVQFLERWRSLVASGLSGQPQAVSDLWRVSAKSVVRGAEPEWTNYLLQCTAAAAWPTASMSRVVSPRQLMDQEKAAEGAKTPRAQGASERPLKQAHASLYVAAQLAAKVYNDMRRAQALLEKMEGSERNEQEVQKRREMQAKLKVEVENARRRQIGAEAQLMAAKERSERDAQTTAPRTPMVSCC